MQAQESLHAGPQNPSVCSWLVGACMHVCIYTFTNMLRTYVCIVLTRNVRAKPSFKPCTECAAAKSPPPELQQRRRCYYYTLLRGLRAAHQFQYNFRTFRVAIAHNSHNSYACTYVHIVAHARHVAGA